ncbi:MAG: UDP-N-acetylmuramoyl-L-alanyl-D-glutamate--2,6-diaminopimelate ligase, partial [Clostridia bacterium]|nr:UDP-N-acetylmuramoyl-L-alanyl-D-glutamate--2,6-diaminopimelate ligase [Clostridia bacterium]
MRNTKLEQIIMSISCETVGMTEGINVNKITCDSREVTRGDMFCCVSGTYSDGHKYAEAAQKSGACVIMCERKLDNITV